MDLKQIKEVYLVGIGGIGMSGLARYFQRRGCFVAGYDRTSTPLTRELEAEGMPISYVDDLSTVPSTFLESRPITGNRQPANDNRQLIIFTPAIPKDSPILNHFQQNGFDLKKRAEVLGIISKGMFTVAVAGTHGKTTTSSMIAHLLKDSGYDCSAFLGGITANYETNVLFGDNDTVVVEADEYDRSFLWLHPDIAVVTSMDPDHLDIYGAKDYLEESFRKFAAQLKPGGKLIKKQSLALDQEGTTYSASLAAQAAAKNIGIKNGSFFFDYQSAAHSIANIELGIAGFHNVENAVAAITVALQLGIQEEAIKAALKSFKGVKRRFEYIIKEGKVQFIDDYAHHPEEIRAFLGSIRKLYPNKKITCVFQPHLFSRTRDFAEGFSETLSLADELILLPIYPARELPIEGVTSEMLLEKVTINAKRVLSKEALIQEIGSRMDLELVVTVGAGDIDALVQPIKELLLAK